MFATEFDAAFAEMDALARAFRGRGFDGHHGLRDAAWSARSPEFVADDEGWTMRADLPGVAEDAVEITIDKGLLWVKAARSASMDDDTWTLRHREREATVLHHRFLLPDRADVDGIEARLSNGVLTVTLPRHAEVAPRRIAVRSN